MNKIWLRFAQVWEKNGHSFSFDGKIVDFSSWLIQCEEFDLFLG